MLDLDALRGLDVELGQGYLFLDDHVTLDVNAEAGHEVSGGRLLTPSS